MVSFQLQVYQVIQSANSIQLGVKLQVVEMVKRRKLVFFGHVCRQKGLVRDVIVGVHPGKRRRGRPRRQYVDDIKEWTGATLGAAARKTEDRERWRALVRETTRTEDG